MSTTTAFRNDSDKVVKFKIWGDPNMAPSEYVVEPGAIVHVPNGYSGNFMKRRAPGCVRVDENPEPPKKAEGAKPEEKPEEKPEDSSPLKGLEGKSKGGKGKGKQ